MVAVLKTSIMVVFCFFVAFILREIFVFVYLFIDTRWVPDTRLKPGGYGYDFLPVGTGMCTKFYP
jgi:hypothetical protein